MTDSLSLKWRVALITAILATTSCTSGVQPPESLETQGSPPGEPLTKQPETIELLPDLTMDFYWDITYTSDCPWDGPGYLIVRGRNIGGGDASGFQIKVWSDSKPIEALPKGEHVQVRFDFEAGPVGSILAIIDPDDQVFESDETNNEFQIIFTPPPRCTPAGG